MNIQEVKENSLKTIKNNFKQLQVLCTKIFKITPQSNEVLMARDVAKYISCIGLGINPSMIDMNTDSVINEFWQQTKLLTDFTKIKTLPIYSFCTGNVQTLRACFNVYFTKRIESLKSYDSLFYYTDPNASNTTDAPKKKTKVGSFLSKLSNSKLGQEAKSKGQDYLIEKGTNAAEDFSKWLRDETGIGKGEGNAYNSGTPLYMIYKYFPLAEYAYKTLPEKENMSLNYQKGTWIPLIEKESGLDFWTIQYYFEKRLFPKVHAGYYGDKNAPDNMQKFYADVKKEAAKDQQTALTNLTQKTNPIKAFLTSIGL